MENTEQIEQQNTNKVGIAAKVDPAIYEIIERLATEDERSISNTVERLLRSNPYIKSVLESDAAIGV